MFCLVTSITSETAQAVFDTSFDLSMSDPEFVDYLSSSTHKLVCDSGSQLCTLHILYVFLFNRPDRYIYIYI